MTTRKRRSQPKTTTDALAATPVAEAPRNTILQGDCLERLRELPDNSLDCCITDPPYGLGEVRDLAGLLRAWMAGESDTSAHVGKSGFMGQSWDATVPPPAVWREVFRVLKPGAHLLCFAGTRTWDLMSLSIRLAGFEDRDTIAAQMQAPGLCWTYGSGFPKGLDVSKQIDRLRRAQRPVVGRYQGATNIGKGSANSYIVDEEHRGHPRTLVEVTTPATAEARQWDGWNIALKPSWEPVLVFRKPLAKGMTIAGNVLAFGTGALNVNATRVGVDALPEPREGRGSMFGGERSGVTPVRIGRWPPNSLWSHSPECRPIPEVAATKRIKGASAEQRARPRGVGGLFSDVSTTPCGPQYGDEVVQQWDCAPDCPVALLDRQSGISRSRASGYDWRPGAQDNPVHLNHNIKSAVHYGDEGTASRYFPTFHPNDGYEQDADNPATDADFGEVRAPFFYCAKASRRERGEGCDALPLRPAGGLSGRRDGSLDHLPVTQSGVGALRDGGRGTMGRNTHPTVKPQALMRWLARLVTPPRGLILDPFAGSGSTGVAAIHERFDYLLIEQEPEYVAIAQARCAHAQAQRDAQSSEATVAAMKRRKPRPVAAKAAQRRRAPNTLTPLPLPLIEATA